MLNIDDCRNRPLMFQDDYLCSSDHSLASIDVASLVYSVSMMYATMDELDCQQCWDWSCSVMRFDNPIISLKFVQLVMNSNWMNLMADYCYLWMAWWRRDLLRVAKATRVASVHR